MKVYDFKLGRLGNAIFRYLASTLFRIIYKADRTYYEEEITQCFNDNYFKNWMGLVLKNEIPNIDNNQNYGFYGYYQHDEIYIKYKKELINWIILHPNDLIFTDGNYSNITNFNYNSQSYNAIDIIPKKINKIYEVVIHLRLEDFIQNNHVIHPLSIKNILDKLNKQIYCFVINKPKTDIEFLYLDYFMNYGKENNCQIICESNDVITDYQIMCNSKILICSYSTLSWCASLLSESIELVYFINYDMTNTHSTFKNPIKNTILYDFVFCGKNELELFFNNNKIKKDIYCAVDCTRKPITHNIFKYIKNIKNGFYVEAGAYDGILQSNTKFLEDEYGWCGILIEPSPLIFEQLKINRPDNININKCLVSNKYNNTKISGAFDNGPMSSVNNIRNIENAKIISVECDTLENIFNSLNIENIDFMSIDTEGYEFEVLEGLNINKYRPTYLLIEIYINDKNKIFNFLEKNNYIFLENITNYNIYDNPGWDGTHNDYLFKSM